MHSTMIEATFRSSRLSTDEEDAKEKVLKVHVNKERERAAAKCLFMFFDDYQRYRRIAEYKKSRRILTRIAFLRTCRLWIKNFIKRIDGGDGFDSFVFLQVWSRISCKTISLPTLFKNA